MVSHSSNVPASQQPQRLEGAQPQGIREQFAQYPDGPPPHFNTPNRQELIEARAVIGDLGSAQGEQLSHATQVILRDTVAMAREFLMASARDMGHSVDPSTWGTAREVEGACELTLYPVYFRLADNGITASRIQQGQSEDLQDGMSVRHAFTVVAMPDGNDYLIDPTLRQFFRPDSESDRSREPGAPPSGKSIGDPGRYLREHPDQLQRQLAWELLRDGYVALHKEFAEVYLRALRRDLDPVDTGLSAPKMKDIIRPNPAIARGTMLLENDDGIPLVPGLPEGHSR